MQVHYVNAFITMIFLSDIEDLKDTSHLFGRVKALCQSSELFEATSTITENAITILQDVDKKCSVFLFLSPCCYKLKLDEKLVFTIIRFASFTGTLTPPGNNNKDRALTLPNRTDAIIPALDVTMYFD